MRQDELSFASRVESIDSNRMLIQPRRVDGLGMITFRQITEFLLSK